MAPIEQMIQENLSQGIRTHRGGLLQLSCPAGFHQETSDKFRQRYRTSFPREIEAAITKTDITAKPGGLEIIVTRVFDAPREPVFKVYADPNLIAAWWDTKNSPSL